MRSRVDLLVDQTGQNVQNEALEPGGSIQGLDREAHEEWGQWVPARTHVQTGLGSQTSVRKHVHIPTLQRPGT